MKYLRFLLTLCPVLLLAYSLDQELNGIFDSIERKIFFIPRIVLGGLIGTNLFRIHRWIWDNDDFEKQSIK